MIASDDALVDVMLSERRDLAAAETLLQSARAFTGIKPDRVTADGHDAYPRAIRTELASVCGIARTNTWTTASSSLALMGIRKVATTVRL